MVSLIILIIASIFFMSLYCIFLFITLKCLCKLIFLILLIILSKNFLSEFTNVEFQI